LPRRSSKASSDYPDEVPITTIQQVIMIVIQILTATVVQSDEDSNSHSTKACHSRDNDSNSRKVQKLTIVKRGIPIVKYIHSPK
jgi:hypothetical protein